MGSDIQSNSIGILGTTDFNPRSPCGERLSCFYDDFQRKVFQSTLPVWGATCCMLRVFPGFPYFNPRSPCGERRRATAGGRRKGDFNPRSPCGERLCPQPHVPRQLYFNPRSPCGERLEVVTDMRRKRFISIHAPRVGSDALWLWTPAWRTPDYNPRSPCGERLGVLLLYLLAVAISIHAPRVGSDQALRGDLRQRRDFNPRSPCGERLIAQALVVGRVNISIHAPRVGSDGILRECSVGVAVFQSTLPVWGATADIHK